MSIPIPISVRHRLAPVLVRHLALLQLAAGAAACGWFEVEEPAGGSDAAPAGAWRIQVAALAAGDQFGASVAASPDRIAVGAPGDDRQGSESGAVHFFSPAGGGGWSEEGVL